MSRAGTRRFLTAAVVVVMTAAACDQEPARHTRVDSGPPAADVAAGDVDLGDPQRPPRGQASLEAWLAAGHHRAWRCETVVSPARLSGNHGRHRICQNDRLLASTDGSYPVGAASVKELYRGGEAPAGFAVGLKVEEGEGTNTWYWYERIGAATARPLADGLGPPQCAVCHVTAARDYVFFRAP